MSFIDGAFFFFFFYVHRICRQIIGVPARPSSIINISCPKLIPHGIGAGKRYLQKLATVLPRSSLLFLQLSNWKIFKYNASIKRAYKKRLISDQLFSSDFSEQAGYVINISADNPRYWCLKRMERLSRSDTSLLAALLS